MEEDQKLNHICKFCSKCFPCGRSLGGHMRSHLINISSSDHQNHKNDKKLPKKRLPPLITDDFINDPKKPSKDTLLKEKVCKQCGKSFQSWKALFGHMKCHRAVKEDSFNSSSENQKLVLDSQSDNETTTIPLCRRKRSDRVSKRYTNSSSLNAHNVSTSCVSEIDELEEQEEVALSLIMLSMDTGNSGVESSNNSSEFIIEAKKNKNLDVKSSKSNNSGEFLKFKKLRNGKLEPLVKDKLKKPSESRTFDNDQRFKVGVTFDGVEKKKKKNLEVEGNESEVTSPKYVIKESQFERDCEKNKKSNKRKCIDSELDYKLALASDQSETSQDFEKGSKFKCVICKKAFPSYQALGGHRASHKKFNGCCAPTSQNDNEKSPNQNKPIIKSDNLFGAFEPRVDSEVGLKKNKDHECPICFRVFPSGQALGGHKRSHLIADQAKRSSSTNPSVEVQKPIPEFRNFLDLNLPAPVEEECHEFQPWWMGTGLKLEREPLLGLL